ncbi:MAG TPA: DUF362 domain-containing protein [Thermoanaerobaculia bacterium]
MLDDLQPEDFWPGSAVRADHLLLIESEAERAAVLDPQSDTSWKKAFFSRLAAFFDRHAGSAPWLVKTSTTGDRAPESEVSADLLRDILHFAVSRLGRDGVLLGDGPAYARDYPSECRRLGWGPLLEEAGIAVVDLNQDDAREIAPGWPVSIRFLQAGAVINLCRAKTHRRFGVSLSAKSLLGALSGAALGYPKLIGRHGAVPWLLVELERRAPPMFSVIDGNPGVDGEGPLRAKPNGSHFIVFGEGCYGPDVRATIEMGFDPILVPGLIRPGRREYEEREVRWSELRQTGTDFLPAASCSWLYRSLRKRRRRDAEYRALRDGIRARWQRVAGWNADVHAPGSGEERER